MTVKERHLIGSQVMHFAGGGTGAVAYVPPDYPEDLGRTFDAARTAELFRRAADMVEAGDGVEAMQAGGEAWARLALFHRTAGLFSSTPADQPVCPQCGEPGVELEPTPMGRTFQCLNCERGDSPDGTVALGPVLFNLEGEEL